MSELKHSAKELGRGQELRVPKTAELVADRIRGRIISGDLEEGATLPPEGQLMEQFGISRPTLREAFRILETERLIAVSRGSRTGARVSRPHVSSVSRYASFVLQANNVGVPDLFEARLAIELFAVRQLARKGSKTKLKALRTEIDRVEGIGLGDTTQEFFAAFNDAHRLLVELGGNETLHVVIQMLQGLMGQVSLKIIALHEETTEHEKKKVIKSFRNLIDLIETGDGDAAAQHWRLHLINANKRWDYDGTLRDILKD
ncbi:MAG: FCD domain-containing protein [Erythrobacter sp.]